MRRFPSTEGVMWDAIVGHESWGTFVVLFSPVAGGAARKAILAGETALAAETELDAKTEDDLRELLAQSSPW